MHPFGFGATPYGVYPTREQVVQYQRRALEQEIHVIEERQRQAQRQHRRQVILNQAQQVEALLNRVQNGRSAAASGQAPPLPKTPIPTNREHQSTPVEWMLIKLAQQNEELHKMMKHHFSNPSMGIRDSSSDIRTESNSSARLLSNSPISPHSRTDERARSPESVAESGAGAREEARPRTMPSPSPARTWAAVEDLPDVDWTDNDEELLEQLLREKANVCSTLPGDNTVSNGDIGSSGMADVLKRKEQQDRQESRRKLTQLYDTSSFANSSGIRRPRWRIEQDIDNGVVRPFVENGEGATSEQPMPVRQLFRSAVIAVLAVVQLQRLLYGKRLQLRDKSIQDLEPMLNVYHDATRVWLGKITKIPLLSIVQDPALDIDVSTKPGLFQVSKGISKWFGRNRSTSTIQTTQGSVKNPPTADQSRTVKLKVRVKGIVDAIVKAIEKGDIPSGILEFWKRLTSDGVYFPSMYPLFALERQALDLDALGATRNMRSDCTVLPGQSYSRFEVVLANFMLLRLLIPHVVLRPWESGIGAAANAPRVVAINLKNVATLLYAIVGRLSPLPPVGTDLDQSMRGGVRRRSIEVVPVTGPLDVPSPLGNNQEEEPTEATRYMLITDIHQLLIPDKHFPLSQFEPFVIEQYTRLRLALQVLHAKLHPAPNDDDQANTE